MAKHSTNGPLRWHRDEIEFFRRAGVNVTEKNAIDGLNKVRERWIHNTLREVFLVQNKFVIKRYTNFPGKIDRRSIWLKEHKAMSKLRSPAIPESMGFIQVIHEHGLTSHTHLRTMIRGWQPDWTDASTPERIARLLADIHREGVVTLDPQAENFIESESEGLGVIDFGRARTHRFLSPFALFNIGKELLKFRREGGLTTNAFSEFLQIYRQHWFGHPWQWRIVQFSYRYWDRRYKKKNRRHHPPGE